MEFIDLKSQYRAYRNEIDAAVLAVMGDAQFIGGSEVDRFEEELAEYVGRGYCVSCGNGTDALQLAYMAYGVSAGDAVFCPDMTFISSVEPAVMLGATPVFCDIDSETYNIDPVDLERRIDDVKREGLLRPKFVVAVDFLGAPADYDALQAVCKKHGLTLIEDAAQGIGGSYSGNMLGSFGDIATTSFFPSKPLGCFGDGGAVFTDNEDVAQLLRSIKVHGKGQSKYDNVRIGVNSRLDNLQAAVLRVKLSHLEDEMLVRQEVAKRYDDALSDYVKCPHVPEGSRSAYAQYALVATSPEEREALMNSLNSQGIPSLVYYPNTMREMRAFDGAVPEESSNAYWYAKRNFALPMSAFLAESDQDEVIRTILGAVFSK